MGKNIAIKVENLSKAYQLGEIGTGTISRDLERFWTTKIRGKEDPFLKIGEANDRSVKGESDIVWSLKDINFEIEQGDAVGIIGRNGAGKSTLLKLLSRVTSPTKGNIRVKGRIAALLEVGTGFHPELTGRENIYLNGAILGMRKKEITRKFDEIVNFSGVARYIDTPVKRYSSGMYVRLAFAVAAHLESEILIVDEVLAVGDAEFQKKCLGKMGEVSQGEGRTVLFVSHNLSSISELCKKSILMSQGSVIKFDETSNVIGEYLSVEPSKVIENYYQDCPINISGVTIRDFNDKVISNFNMEENFSIFLELKQISHIEYIIGVQFINSMGVPVCHFMSLDQNLIFLNNESIRIDVYDINLYPDIYNLNIFICDKKDSVIWGVVKVNGAFTIMQNKDKIKRNLKVAQGIIFPKFKFRL